MNRTRKVGLITITDIIPVDLNSILYANEVVLQKWHAAAGNKTMAAYYLVWCSLVLQN